MFVSLDCVRVAPNLAGDTANSMHKESHIIPQGEKMSIGVSVYKGGGQDDCRCNDSR